MKYLITLLLGAACAVAVMNWDSFRSSSPARRFEDLSRANQKFVKSAYQELLQAHERHDFAQMKASADAILAKLPDYNDTRGYLEIAKRKITQ